jgi:hypothetical protein
MAKRKGGVFQRLGNWLIGTEPPSEQDAIIASKHNTYSSMSSEYDDTPINQMVGSTRCKTVGEYKTACIKKYGPDGYGP